MAACRPIARRVVQLLAGNVGEQALEGDRTEASPRPLAGRA